MSRFYGHPVVALVIVHIHVICLGSSLYACCCFGGLCVYCIHSTSILIPCDLWYALIFLFIFIIDILFIIYVCMMVPLTFR